MNNYFLVDASDVVIGTVKSLNEFPATTNLKFFRGDANAAYINTKKYNGTILTDYTPPVRILTKLAFNLRFTVDELVAIKNATKTDSTVDVLWERFSIAMDIDLDDIVVIQGMQALVDLTLLTQSRMVEILGNPTV